MPTVVIGPTVAIIGLSLAGNAIGDLQKGGVTDADGTPVAATLICVLVGLITLIVTTVCSTFGKKMVKLIPFIIGILAGYAVAVVFTVIGNAAGIDALKIISFQSFTSLVDGGVSLETFIHIPQFTFIKAISALLRWHMCLLHSSFSQSTLPTTRTSPLSSERIFWRIPVLRTPFLATV